MPTGRVVVADDDNVGISVEAVKVDSEGDLGYVLEIVNKTPGKVYVYPGSGWKARGANAPDPVLRELVDSGQSTEAFMWFDRRSFGTSFPDGLYDVEGSIVVQDAATSSIIGEYAFEM